MTKEAMNKLRFHWSILRKDVTNDIELAKNAVVEK